MKGGYAGKILRLNLATRTATVIETAKYEDDMGGAAMGAAIFWDLVADKAIGAFDPRNTLVMTTTPLSGTIAPTGGARIEMCGIGATTFPTEVFTRGNLGGRMGAELKFAGWDGLVIEGKSDAPVWIKIVNDKVSFEDASDLWGLDTWKAQELVWQKNGFERGFDEWVQMGRLKEGTRTAQGPAVMCIGPIGEVQSRMATIQHDAGHCIAMAGFGAVWGAKNLKAISVIGTGSVKVADPKALLEARKWTQNYCRRPDDPYADPSLRVPDAVKGTAMEYYWGPSHFNGPVGGTYYGPNPGGPLGCFSCHKNCHQRTSGGKGTGAFCGITFVWNGPLAEGVEFLKATCDPDDVSGMMNRYGINGTSLLWGLTYLWTLHRDGILGKGKQIHSDLPFELMYKDPEFFAMFCDSIVKGEDIGLALRGDFVRAAQSWGRLEEDMKSGILEFPYHGSPVYYDPRVELDWGYGSVLGERTTNDHDFNPLVYWSAMVPFVLGYAPVSAKECAEIVAEKLVPFEGDPRMIDYSTENMYSDHIVKLVAWQRRYSRSWKNSVGYCDMCFADFVNAYAPGKRGLTPEGEPKFFNAVTGKNFSFADGIEVGRKAWNLENAIWALQGRHRDMVKFSDYVYDQPVKGLRPVLAYVDGEWIFQDVGGRKLDREKFEDFKTRYYEFEGWDPKTGWPTRSTLAELGLENVADELERHGKLGYAQ